LKGQKHRLALVERAERALLATKRGPREREPLERERVLRLVPVEELFRLILFRENQG
jgi:hypothetical protein